MGVQGARDYKHQLEDLAFFRASYNPNIFICGSRTTHEAKGESRNPKSELQQNVKSEIRKPEIRLICLPGSPNFFVVQTFGCLFVFLLLFEAVHVHVRSWGRQRICTICNNWKI